MRVINDTKLDFQDVLLVPKRSSLSSRKDVDIIRTYKFKHSPKTITGTGIIAANMDVVGTIPIAREMAKYSMYTALHKHYSISELKDVFIDEALSSFVFYSIGTNDRDTEKLSILAKEGILPQNICIDVANGYSQKFIDHVKRIRDSYPDSIIMAGNCVTPELAEQLIISGADIVKAGIGSGAMCTTRIVAGVGYPQFSAVVETADAVHGLEGHLCSDGGCIHPGDVAKAFGAGADFVMLGSMLAGHDECDGEIVVINDKKYMKFFGMSSKTAQEKFNGGVSSYRASEGRTAMIPYKGNLSNTIQQIQGGLRSACTYCGALSIKELTKRATFVKINRTHNTTYENTTIGF